jgi:hypothetical protein
MKIARLVDIALVAVALSLVAVSAASAAEALFRPASSTVTGTSGAVILIANNGVDVVECPESHATGTISSALLLGNVVFHYLSCTSSGPSEDDCPVRSTNATAGGLIITNTLHGILGLILPSRETGILFLPSGVGKEWFTLEGNACTSEAAVTGTVAGLVEPIGSLQTTGKILFEREPGPGNTQGILDIDLTHGLGLVVPKLVAFTTADTLTQLEAITYTPATEVT